MPPTLRLESGYGVYGNKRPKVNYPPGTVPPDELAVPHAATPAPATATTPAPTAANTAQPHSLIKPRSLSSAVQGLADSYLGKLNAAPVTADDVMGSQEYQQREKGIDLAMGQAQAGIRRRLASMGSLRSTPAIQAQNESAAYYGAQKGALTTDLINAAQARQQQALGNTRSAMGDMAALDNASFNQGVTEFQTTAPYTMMTKGQEADNAFRESGRASDIAFRESDITGRYLSPAAKGLAETILKAKAGNATGQDPAMAAQAADARSQLSAMGYDANLFGSDVTLDQARQNMGQLGVRTAAATAGDQSLAFNEAAVTGRYLPPAVRGLYNQVVQLKQQNAQGQNPAAAQQADAIRGQIAAAGYDPNLVGGDVAVGQAQANVGQAGIQTPQARAAALQEQRGAIALDMDRLQAQIAQNPDVGAMAQAQLEMQAKRKQIEQMDAQIKASTAKSLSGGGDGGNPFTAWQQYQILRDEKGDGDKSTAAEEKARENLVDSFRSDYTVSKAGADLWADFMDIATTPKDDGTLAGRDELNELSAIMVENPAIPAADKDWVRKMFWAGQGEQWAQDELNAKYRKKPLNPDGTPKE